MDSTKEIKVGEELQTKLLAGVNKLANTVVSTLGPNGSTVIIANEYGEPYITKDGVSVSNYITLEDPVENIAATLLKQVAQKTVEEAGDGTTTSICLAQAFINRGIELLESGSTYNELKKELEVLEEITIEQLFKSSKELDKNNIVDVATISANNDKLIGEIIQKAYNHSDIVKVEEGNTTEDELITIHGMEFNTGYLDNAFINTPAKQAIIYEEPLVLIIRGKLTKLDNIAPLLHKADKKPIVIIADHVDGQVRSILRDNYNKGALNIALVKSPGFAGHRKNLVEDLAIYTGATIIEPNVKYTDSSVFGSLNSINIGKAKTIFTNEHASILSNKRLLDITEVYRNTSDDEMDKVLLRQRIENLNGKIAIIKVGGKSEVEMKERKDRMDDSVLAVQCALEEGVVEGGGCALYRTKITNKFDKCLGAPLQTILFNGADFNYLQNVLDLNIMDPVKVTRCALQNAISVAKTILGTKAMVLNERLWR